jgi:hypothetical protein
MSVSFHSLSNTLQSELMAVPVQTWTGPEGSMRLRLPEFLDSRHKRVVKLSVLRTGRLYPAGDTSGTHFC